VIGSTGSRSTADKYAHERKAAPDAQRAARDYLKRLTGTRETVQPRSAAIASSIRN
jgi:hypothetical protein